MECLKMAPAQRFSKKLDPVQTADMIRESVQSPDKRRALIQNAVATSAILRFANNEYLKAFGVSIDPKMIEVPARALPAPSVEVKGPKGVVEAMAVRDGVWNMSKKNVISSPRIPSYAFVFFFKFDDRTAAQIAFNLVQMWRAAGVDLAVAKNCATVIGNPFRAGNVKAKLMAGYQAAKTTFKVLPTILFCVLDPFCKNLHDDIKRVTLFEAGVMSQCMMERHLRSPDAIKEMHARNVALKVHPSRVEIIANMETIFGAGLDAFRDANGRKSPVHVIFYRDGVASGQFKAVRDVEVKGCLVAIHKRGLAGKCKIDTDIVHPTEFNFVLQSHAGLQGTSRPTIYHVVHDDIKFGSDNLQQLSYHLAHLSQRSTRAISMVAPAHQAHVLAYCDFHSEGSPSTPPRDADLKLQRLHSNVSKLMFYV
ncbi:ribonuclease H-like domain-containing protein [Blyttiomyces helicus]|uniref:Ribonuclease H-like domain-containing protein n=1 Tax=Blyttiomyces helicus TaxID=388810 RepID=A0A4P9VZ29_9FUNG|nr:ribonuclease H-like domain-containing protein [Blyttiomyces helicus]|eukprot:RKO83056.1 ribonuclease H-like domain-containing protein [Blyttiomyces helicus]